MSGALLVAGTTSDAGKSIVTTGLCRAAMAITAQRVWGAENLGESSETRARVDFCAPGIELGSGRRP